MKVRQLDYLIKEGIKSVWTNGLMSLAAIFTVAAGLSIIGIFYLVSDNINYLTDQVKAQCQIQVFVENDLSPENVEKIGEEIKNIPEVTKCEFFSKDQALSYMREVYSDYPYLMEGFEEDNPLKASYKIEVVKAEILTSVAEKIKGMTGVASVSNREETVQRLTDTTRFVNIVAFWLMAILSFISVLIISNTIKIAFHNRQREISVMKYVGATNSFITMPFIIEGIIIGFLGASISYGIIIFSYDYAFSWWYEFVDTYKLLNLSAFLKKLTITYVCTGTLLGATGSVLSIKKFLKV